MCDFRYNKTFTNYAFDVSCNLVYSLKSKKYLIPYYSTKTNKYRVKLYYGDGTFVQWNMRRVARFFKCEKDLPKKIKYKNIIEEIFL